MFEPKRDVNASLQVEHGSIHNLSAVDLDLHNRDHVRLVNWLASFRGKLASI